MEKKNLTLNERLNAPTPKFFKKIRNVGLTLGAIGGALLAAPLTLPAAVVTVAGYLVTAGLVASAVSVTAVDDPQSPQPNKMVIRKKKSEVSNQ